jgi:hypothetical protein
MLKRYLFLAGLTISVVACQRLSPNERKVVGTWELRLMDATGFKIFNADHSYASVADASNDPRVPRLLLTCAGTWRIEGDDLITDCMAAYGSESVKKPERHVEREKLAEFFKSVTPHGPLSYERLP